MNTKTCSDCQNFRQHYIINEKHCTWVNYGHCIKHIVKRISPDSKACCDFTQKEPPTETHITKDYVTKELLKYIQTLELPPDISKDSSNI